MARVKVVWKRDVFAEVRTLPGVMAAVNTIAAPMADNANSGMDPDPDGPNFYYVSPYETGGRVRGRAQVGTRSYRARAVNARDNTLLKAMRRAQ